MEISNSFFCIYFHLLSIGIFYRCWCEKKFSNWQIPNNDSNIATISLYTCKRSLKCIFSHWLILVYVFTIVERVFGTKLHMQICANKKLFVFRSSPLWKHVKLIGLICHLYLVYIGNFIFWNHSKSCLFWLFICSRFINKKNSVTR